MIRWAYCSPLSSFAASSDGRSECHEGALYPERFSGGRCWQPRRRADALGAIERADAARCRFDGGGFDGGIVPQSGLSRARRAGAGPAARVSLPHAATNHVVAATHAVLVPGTLDKIADAGVRELLVTDSIEPRGSSRPWCRLLRLSRRQFDGYSTAAPCASSPDAISHDTGHA